jgi:hypothetical protein
MIIGVKVSINDAHLWAVYILYTLLEMLMGYLSSVEILPM